MLFMLIKNYKYLTKEFNLLYFTENCPSSF